MILFWKTFMFKKYLFCKIFWKLFFRKWNLRKLINGSQDMIIFRPTSKWLGCAFHKRSILYLQMTVHIEFFDKILGALNSDVIIWSYCCLKNYQCYPNWHESIFEDWIFWKIVFKNDHFPKISNKNLKNHFFQKISKKVLKTIFEIFFENILCEEQFLNLQNSILLNVEDKIIELRSDFCCLNDFQQDENQYWIFCIQN